MSSVRKFLGGEASHASGRDLIVFQSRMIISERVVRNVVVLQESLTYSARGNFVGYEFKF